MNKVPEKRKLQVDTSNYISAGKGVRTDELIEDPSANDDLWSTIETEEFFGEEPKRIEPRLLINLIRQDIVEDQEKYLNLVEIEKHFFPKVKSSDMFSKKGFFDNYKENKTRIVKKLKIAAKSIYIYLSEEKPELIESIRENEKFVIENLINIFREKIIIINKSGLNKKDVKKLALGFLYAFKLIAESSRKGPKE